MPERHLDPAHRGEGFDLRRCLGTYEGDPKIASLGPSSSNVPSATTPMAGFGCPPRRPLLATSRPKRRDFALISVRAGRRWAPKVRSLPWLRVRYFSDEFNPRVTE
jgi:hypothetical protein